MTRLTALAAILVVGIFSAVFTAHATTRDFTDPAAFAAATANPTTIGFNGILPPGVLFENFNPLIVSGVSFSTPTPGTFVNVTVSTFYSPNNYPAAFIVDSANPSSSNELIISLSKPTFALALVYGGLGFTGVGTGTFTLSNGHVFTQPNLPTVGHTAFVGFVSTDPITTLTLVTSNDSWVVENLVLATSASNVDFNCTPSNCTGTVAHSGPNFSSSGISLFNNTGTYSSSIPFTLAFDTNTKVITLMGTGAATGQDLAGTITSFRPVSGGLVMNVNWTTLPGAVASQLGTSTGVGVTSVLFLVGGTATSVDLLIMPLGQQAAARAQTLLGRPYIEGGKGYDMATKNNNPPYPYVSTDTISTGYLHCTTSGCPPTISPDTHPETKKPGIDCSGLVLWSYNTAAGSSKTSSSDPIPRPNDEGADDQYLNSQHVDPNNLKPGDLLFFNYGAAAVGHADHVAMYVGSTSSHPEGEVDEAYLGTKGIISSSCDITGSCQRGRQDPCDSPLDSTPCTGNGVKLPSCAGVTNTIVAANGAIRRSNIVTITTISPHGLNVGQKVVITGVSDSSFNSFDPPSRIATVPSPTSFTYQQFRANATSGGGSVSAVPCFVDYRRPTLSPNFGISIRLHSPATLAVTDPDGNIITADTLFVSEREVLREIPGELYYSADSEGGDEVIGRILKPGNYYITILPKSGAAATDTYSLTVTTASQTVILAQDVPISQIPPLGYGIESAGSAITPFIPVAIDIKPGSSLNPINPRSSGTIPVAILSSKTFNALSQVAVNSLTFGRTGTEPSLAFCNSGGEDVNGDGLLDLVCHFYTQKTGFQVGDTTGIVRGRTAGGQLIRGVDSIHIVP